MATIKGKTFTDFEREGSANPFEQGSFMFVQRMTDESMGSFDTEIEEWQKKDKEMDNDMRGFHELLGLSIESASFYDIIVYHLYLGLCRVYGADKGLELTKQFRERHVESLGLRLLTYIKLAQEGHVVNVYLYGDNLGMLTNIEHEWFFVHHLNIRESYQVVNFNNILVDAGLLDSYSNKNYLYEYFYYQQMFEKIDDLGVKIEDISVNYRKNRPYSFSINGKETDLNRYKEIDEKIEFGQVGYKRYKGIKKNIVIEERINAEQECEKMNNKDNNNLIEFEIFMDIMNDASNYYAKASYVQKRKIIEIFFSNIIVDNKKS